MTSNKSDADKEKAEKDTSPQTQADEKAYFEKLQLTGFEKKREQIDQKLKETTQKLKETTQKLKELQGLEKRLEKTESKLVEILGIFTAIVVTFVGTFAFSSSVFQNMEKGDIHRLIFVVLCIAVFIASILRWLFDFLLRICGKETQENKFPIDKLFSTKLWRLFSTKPWWVVLVVIFLLGGGGDWLSWHYSPASQTCQGSSSGCATNPKKININIKLRNDEITFSFPFLMCEACSAAS